MYDWLIQNKELLKIAYSFLIAIICLVIVFRTDRLFRLSMHQGIRYFRNAFLFYAIAFVFRYLLNPVIGTKYFSITNALFEYFLIMAGFFLLYSLIWKKFETTKPALSSLFNPRILTFYLMALILVISDYIWSTYNLMFLSQIIIFIFATAISFSNYRSRPKGKFLKFYFIAMLLSLLAWALNALAAAILAWNQLVLINIYALNMIIFLLFLFGVIKFTNKNG